MSYYLSHENRKFLIPFVRLLEKSKGRIELPTKDPKSLIYILRAGANTEFTLLKNWRYSMKHDHVLAIPKNPSSIEPIIHDTYIDYLGLVQILISDKPEIIHFTNAYLTDKEYEKLITTCERLEYKIEKSDNLIKISR